MTKAKQDHNTTQAQRSVLTRLSTTGGASLAIDTVNPPIRFTTAKALNKRGLAVLEVKRGRGWCLTITKAGHAALVAGPRITAAKKGGDDAASWAVLVNGQAAFTGLTRSELPYYKRLALQQQGGAL